MPYVPFRHITELKGACHNFSKAYSIFLQSVNVPVSLEDEIRRLMQMEEEDDDTNEVYELY